MNIYTTYFANLKNLPKSIVPISVARYSPKGWLGYELKEYAPSSELLIRYKSDHNWDTYVDNYNDQLSHSIPYALLMQLEKISKGMDVALVCYEKDYTHCHRFLIAKWLGTIGIECNEWK